MIGKVWLVDGRANPSSRRQDAAAARAAERAPLTDAEQALAALQHTRKRLLAEMAASGNPRFRDLKARALAHVDAKIAALLESRG